MSHFRKETSSPVSWTRRGLRFVDMKEVWRVEFVRLTAMRTSTSKSVERYQEVTRFSRSRLSKMHLHCDSRPHSCMLLASYRRAALRTEWSHSSLSRKARRAWQRKRAFRTPNWLKTVITRRIRKRALFRRWCKWHVSVIDRKNVIAKRPARRSARRGRVQRSVGNEKRMHAQPTGTESAHYYFILRIDLSCCFNVWNRLETLN